MSSRGEIAFQTLRRRTPIGLYLIMAYCVLAFVRFPFQLPLPEEMYLGPFRLEGSQVVVGIAITLALWLLLLVALVVRRPWTRVFALAVFGAHMALLVAGAIRWLITWREAAATGDPAHYRVSPDSAFRIIGWPTLQLLIPSALAFAYIAMRRRLFNKEGAPA